MTHKLILHVGAPKTGTSHMQDLLFRNPDALAAIQAQTWQDGRLRTVTLGSLGSFRVDSQTTGTGDGTTQLGGIG